MVLLDDAEGVALGLLQLEMEIAGIVLGGLGLLGLEGLVGKGQIITSLLKNSPGPPFTPFFALPPI